MAVPAVVVGSIEVGVGMALAPAILQSCIAEANLTDQRTAALSTPPVAGIGLGEVALEVPRHRNTSASIELSVVEAAAASQAAASGTGVAVIGAGLAGRAAYQVEPG